MFVYVCSGPIQGARPIQIYNYKNGLEIFAEPEDLPDSEIPSPILRHRLKEKARISHKSMKQIPKTERIRIKSEVINSVLVGTGRVSS